MSASLLPAGLGPRLFCLRVWVRVSFGRSGTVRVSFGRSGTVRLLCLRDRGVERVPEVKNRSVERVPEVRKVAKVALLSNLSEKPLEARVALLYRPASIRSNGCRADES